MAVNIAASRTKKVAYQIRPTFIVRRFNDVPVEAAKIITRASATYGSQSRALQVAISVLLLSKDPITLRYRSKGAESLTNVAYKLLPQTVEMINRYTPVFGAKGEVIAACSMVLEEIDKKIRRRK